MAETKVSPVENPTVVLDTFSVLEPESGNYAIFERDLLLLSLRIFSSLNRPVQDLQARACFFRRLKGGQFSASMSDGVVFAQVKFSSVRVADNFPDAFVLDFESLFKDISFVNGMVCLVHERGSFYLSFIGGRIYVPAFKIEPRESFEKKFRDGQYKDISFTNLLQCLEVAQSFLSSNSEPELDFLFSSEDSVFLSNGSTVLRMHRDFNIESAIRKSDLSILGASIHLLLRNRETEFKVFEDKKVLIFRSPSVTICFPRVEEVFPASYTQFLSKFNKRGHFAINFSNLYDSIAVLSQNYDSPGLLAFIVREDRLYLEMTSKTKKVSSILLSEKMVGKLVDQKVFFGVEGILGILRCLRAFPSMNLAFTSNSFCLFDELFEMAVFGTAGLVKGVLEAAVEDVRGKSGDR